MSELVLSQVKYPLVKRELEEQFGQLEEIFELVTAALEEQGKVSLHASRTVKESLAKAFRMKKRALLSNRLTPDKEAVLEQLTQEYLNQIRNIVAQTDLAVLTELRRLDPSLAIAAPQVLILDGCE
jgi:hypothetical protein